jgi:hypothetical protein
MTNEYRYPARYEGGRKCVAKIDRIGIVADTGRKRGLPDIDDFRVVRDTRVRQQTTARTYLRCRHLVNDKSGAKAFWQYDPQHAWLPTWKVRLIGDDRDGLMLPDILRVLSYCGDYRLMLVEIAFDFGLATGVDARFIRRHALFGKSHPRSDRGGGDQLRYGGRYSDVLVRAYAKAAVRAFRVEIELHSRPLRINQIRKLEDVSNCARVIVPNHFKMVVIRWPQLRRYLVNRFREAGIRMLEAAKSRSTSIHDALGYLRGNQVNNVHRFLQPIGKNHLVRDAAEAWATKLRGGAQ